MKIEVFKGKDGWRWRLRFSNGRIAASSEAYASKRSASESAERAAVYIHREVTQHGVAVVVADK